MTANPKFRLFDLGINTALSTKVAEQLGVPLSPVEIRTFADHEIYERIVDSVRGIDVYVIAPIADPVNQNFMKLMIFIDAAKRTSAKSINVVIPYMGYARSDRKTRSREPIVARLVADMLESQGIKRVMTMDLHTPQLQGFFDIPVDHLIALPAQVDFLEKAGLVGQEVVCVASGPSTLKLVQRLATEINSQWAIIDGNRDPKQPARVTGNVAGKHAIIVADMVDTGQTMMKAATALKKAGAAEIDGLATHGVFSEQASENLQNSDLDHLFVSDTVAIPEEKQFPKLQVISVASLFAEGLKQVIEQKSLAKVLKPKEEKEG
ncbi:Phosphoribosylpyrophosphate synthetase (PrsA) [Fructobacillus fructosus]|uniref:ribose-phosphate diphosphokinase n=1 Tax=Fructobacillus fructosus TaxID=1631 RepID=UPI00200A1D76|nr:ribose-phosphate diphosphokinase [Fructobacillus fructosus]MCK8638147.1 ribose-phosphate diphosphokinase [Fructobacillus fructosus]CAK1225216.1 Phosphoribosylpyrophosphate synthetase (PrsA) [Fructobacillus fructosus]CAK1226116.1 Phosphoribosylpyrophosphate synthetase (PrsA) [Fructobacillus fructosus]